MEGPGWSSLASGRVETFLEETIGFALLRKKQGFNLVPKAAECNYMVLGLHGLSFITEILGTG